MINTAFLIPADALYITGPQFYKGGPNLPLKRGQCPPNLMGPLFYDTGRALRTFFLLQ